MGRWGQVGRWGGGEAVRWSGGQVGRWAGGEVGRRESVRIHYGVSYRTINDVY